MRMNKKTLAVFICCLAAVAAGGVAIGLNWDALMGGKTATSQGVGMTVDPDAVDWEGELPEETQNPEEQTVSQVPMAKIPGYGALEFNAGTTQQAVNFVNPEGNQCYFIITLCLADGTELYQSQLIPPGKGLYEITLNQSLEAGEYENAKLQYRCISLEDGQTEYNGANVNLTLRVV